MLDKAGEQTAETLDEPFRSKALRAFFVVQKHFRGDKQITVVFRDGYRDTAQQWELYKKGRTWNKDKAIWEITGKIVTRATPKDGPHCYRRAAHIILIDNKLTATRQDDSWLADEDNRWLVVRDAGEAQGLISGARWRDRDMSHVEDMYWRDVKKARFGEPLKADERFIEDE